MSKIINQQYFDFIYYEATLCNGETIDLPLIVEILMVENGINEKDYHSGPTNFIDYQPAISNFEYVGTYYPDEVAIFIDANFDQIEKEFLKEFNW